MNAAYRFIAMVLMGLSIYGCSVVENTVAFGIMVIGGVFQPSDPGNLCKHSPVEAYAMGMKCDTGSGPTASPISQWNVNTKVAGLCPVERSLQFKQQSIYREIWEKGGDPYKCSDGAAQFYLFLTKSCNGVNEPYIQIPADFGKFSGKRSQDLLVYSVMYSCVFGVHTALQKSASPNTKIVSLHPSGWPIEAIPKSLGGKSVLRVAVETLINDNRFVKQQPISSEVVRLLWNAGACLDQDTSKEIEGNLQSLSEPTKSLLQGLQDRPCTT